MPCPKEKDMANSVAKAKLYSDYLDSAVQAGLTSGDLLANPNNIRYNGGNTVAIATVSTTGFTNYDRDNGYTRGSGNLVWNDYTIDYDRAFEFLVDAMDEDESQGVFSSANLLKEFADNDEVPELDTVRYSKIFQAIVDDSTVRYGYYTPAAATLLTQFNNDVAVIRKSAGRNNVLQAKMSESAFNMLTNSTELSKQLNVQNVAGDNGVSTQIFSINGVRITPVPDDRLVTEVAVLATGYSTKAWAQSMNWVIYSTQAVVAFEKHRKMKVFGNGTHTEGDGDLIQGRLYHGVWVMSQKHNMIYVSLKTATITGFDTGVLTTSGATNVTYTLGDLYTNKDTGHEFYYFDGGSAAAKTAPACYDDFSLTGYVKIASAAAVADTVTSTYYGALVEVDENGRAIRFATIQASA